MLLQKFGTFDGSWYIVSFTTISFSDVKLVLVKFFPPVLFSQVRLYDDGRLSAGYSDSPLASAPSSGRNTPVLSLDGVKLDRSTPVPSSLDAVRYLVCLFQVPLFQLQ